MSAIQLPARIKALGAGGHSNGIRNVLVPEEGGHPDRMAVVSENGFAFGKVDTAKAITDEFIRRWNNWDANLAAMLFVADQIESNYDDIDLAYGGDESFLGILRDKLRTQIAACEGGT